ncbi:hypothetical protein B0H11DRAFT_2193021, partial [Mycena galericulata]
MHGHTFKPTALPTSYGDAPVSESQPLETGTSSHSSGLYRRSLGQKRRREREAQENAGKPADSTSINSRRSEAQWARRQRELAAMIQSQLLMPRSGSKRQNADWMLLPVVIQLRLWTEFLTSTLTTGLGFAGRVTGIGCRVTFGV